MSNLYKIRMSVHRKEVVLPLSRNLSPELPGSHENKRKEMTYLLLNLE